MFEKLRLDPDEIRARRQLSLVERWSKGKRLTPEELREIGDVIPREPVPGEAIAPDEIPVPAPAPGPVFSLEPESIKVQPDWEGWAALYKKSPRSLKRWAALGRKCGEDCPLGEPAKMPGWFQRHMKQRVPPELLQAARNSESKEDNGLTETGDPEAPPPEEPPLNMEVSDDEMGLEKTLERLSRTEVQLSRKATAPGQTQAWLNVITRMGTVAEKLRTEGERLGKLLPRDLVEQAIHAFHGPIEREIRLLYRTMCAAMGLQPTPENEARWNEEVDILFRRFGEEVLR